VTGRFGSSSAVRPSGDGRYEAEVAPGWDIAGAANGGYLLATTARALTDATGRPDPVTVTAHYLSPGAPGPALIDTTVVRAGRRFATASATLVAGDRPVLAVLGTFGDLSATAGPEQVDGAPPDLPDPDDCFAMVATDTFPPPFMAQVELRLHPDDAGFTRGEPTGRSRVRGWFRLRDDEPVDTLALLCAVDAFPPTIFNADLPVAWTPTVELTAHVRARPEPGWLACSFATRFVSSGFLEADGEVWDASGRLVAQSRQLALVPRG
jgi:acyl-CoA thioesterase